MTCEGDVSSGDGGLEYRFVLREAQRAALVAIHQLEDTPHLEHEKHTLGEHTGSSPSEE